MAVSVREVEESPQEQGANEQIAYRFQWGDIGTPSSPSTFVFDDETGEDVTTGTTSGSSSASGTNVITAKILNLTAGNTYRVVCRATVDGNVLERYHIIPCTA